MTYRAWIARDHLPSATALPIVAALVLGAFVALMFLSKAGAETGAPRVETFSGLCDMSGVIRHVPPLTNQPTPTQVRGVFRGTCSGELTNRRGRERQIDGGPGAYKARPAGELSCLGGTATGNGRLIIRRKSSGRRHVINLNLTERRTPGVAEVTLEGADGGSGSVTGTVSAMEFVDAGERCSGSGLRRLRGDGRVTSPGISG
jgi:hypothetical protein